MGRTKLWMGAMALACLLGSSPGPAWAQPDDPEVGSDRDIAEAVWGDDEWGPGGDVLAWQGEATDEARYGGPGWGGGGGPAWSGMRMGAGHGSRHRMGRGFGMGLGRLDLTEAQRKRIEEIVDRQMRQSIKARADLRVAELDLRKLMRADVPDRRAIESQIDRIGVMTSGMKKARVGAMLDMRSVLTDEQRKQLQEGRWGTPAPRRGPPSGQPGSGGDR